MLQNEKLKNALNGAYAALDPFSKRFRVDAMRYLFTLNIVGGLAKTGQKILDIGTGIGIMPIALKRMGYDASGLDYYVFPENKNEMFGVRVLEKLKSVWARERVDIKNIDIFSNGTLDEKLNTKFDLIISEATIEHQKDPKRFLERCRSLLNEGGFLVLTTPNIATLLRRLRFLFGLSPLWPVEDFYKHGENFTGHWREYTAKELRWMCSAAGFEITDYYNKNLLARFKSIKDFKKNARALIGTLANLVPGSKEMHYIICKK